MCIPDYCALGRRFTISAPITVPCLKEMKNFPLHVQSHGASQFDSGQQSSCCSGLGICRNPRSDYNWTVRDPNQVGEEYRTLEEKLKTLTRGLNKRVSTLQQSFSKGE